ncbi:MAG TPA: serine/threonine-protein kinase, partial [Polyangiaceae bacterium LLY-WYZ-15_(1-7)]|nr:serine/threonine-protein kinase [Polyangiaceae bacterium LLY-WYZ-15_(1-7)]
MPASSHRRDPFLGLVLDGKYEVRSPIARGGMGRVYRAIQQPLGREVALKVLDLEQLEGKKAGGDFAQRFFNEAAACAKLTHPNTVVVYDYGKTDDEVFYIAMEMLEGRNLEEILDQEAPLEPARVKHLGLQICGSIGEAHGRGMIHRDLKPSNIMLTERGADPDFVKVLDFGLVKQESDAGLTQSGALLGTPRYIAPEQIGSSDVGPESDIYSLGACLYHCLTGRPPFDSDSKFVLLASHINVEPPSIRELQPDTTASDALQSVIMRCLSKEPADRYPTMDALVEALLATPEEAAAARSSLPGKSHGGTSRPGIGPARRLASSLDRSGVRTSEAGAPSPKELDRTAAATPSSILSGSAVDGAPAISTVGGEGGEGRRAPLLLAAVVVGLVGVVGGWFLLRGDGTETEAPAGVAASPEAAPAAPPELEQELPTTQEAPSAQQTE